MSYTPIFNSATPGNFDTPGGPVAAGQIVGGLLENAGGWASVVNSKYTQFGTVDAGFPPSGPYSNGVSYQEGCLFIPGSDAELDSEITGQLAPDGNGGFSIGLIDRAKSVLEPYKRQVYILGMFTYTPTATGEAPRFSLSVYGSGADNILEQTDQGAAWFDPANKDDYRFSLKSTGTNPTVATWTAFKISTGEVVRAKTLTISNADAPYIQTPGLCGLIHGAIHGLQGAGPTVYQSLTCAIAPAAVPLTATMGYAVNSNGTATVTVTPSDGPGDGNYTAKLYAAVDSVNFTPTDTGQNGANQVGAAISIAEGATGTFTLPLAAGVYKGVRVVVSRDTSNTLATTVTAAAGAESDYLVLQGAKPAPGALSALASTYQNGVNLAYWFNSFGGHTTDSNGFTDAETSYLQSHEFASNTVKTCVEAFPGSALGRDWGASSAVYSAGERGPTGVAFGAFGIEGNRNTKNLLANSVDRTLALKAANPTLPTIVQFYELTNAALNNIAPSVVAAEFADVKAMCAANGWKLVLHGPAWIAPGSGYGAATIDALFAAWNACKALCDNAIAFQGDDTWLAYSFATASDTYYGTGADDSGIHPRPLVCPPRGTIWAETVRRGPMAESTPTLTALTVSIGAPDGDNKRQASVTATPSGASTQGGVWSQTGGGSITTGGLSTAPAATNVAQTVTVTYTVGGISDSETYTVPAATQGTGLTTGQAQTLADLAAMIETVGGVVRFKLSALSAWQSVLPVIDPDEELEWAFERVHPAPGKSVPAASTERHLIRVKATRPNGITLSAAELAAFGFEIAFYKGAEARVWRAMQPDTTRNLLPATALSNAFYFSLMVGPGSSSPLVALLAGSYSVSVRVAATPHLERPLGLLTIAPPNP